MATCKKGVHKLPSKQGFPQGFVLEPSHLLIFFIDTLNLKQIYLQSN